MGASIQGRLWPRTDEEAAAAIAQGYDLDRVLHTADLCAGEQVWCHVLHPKLCTPCLPRQMMAK